MIAILIISFCPCRATWNLQPYFHIFRQNLLATGEDVVKVLLISLHDALIGPYLVFTSQMVTPWYLQGGLGGVRVSAIMLITTGFIDCALSSRDWVGYSL